MSRLWLDDIRRPPDDSWDWARTVAEARTLVIAHGSAYSEASLDHDMGLHGYDPDEQDADLRIAPEGTDEEDGMTFVRWLCDVELVPPIVSVHSWNPDGASRMASYLRQASEHLGFDCAITVRPYDAQSVR